MNKEQLKRYKNWRFHVALPFIMVVFVVFVVPCKILEFLSYVVDLISDKFENMSESCLSAMKVDKLIEWVEDGER